LQAAANLKSDKPVKWTEADQAAAAAIATKLQQAQARVEFLEDAMESKDEALREQALLIEQLTKDVEQAQTKLENKMRASRARNLVNAKLNPLVEAAKARRAARKGSDDVLFQSSNDTTPEMAEDLKDLMVYHSGLAEVEVMNSAKQKLESY